MKIKVKKDMFLAELIEWGFDNKVTGETFISAPNGEVTFLDDGWIETPKPIHPRSIFEVEVEQKVDEDTKIPILIEWYEDGDYGATYIHRNKTIKETIDDFDNDLKEKTKAFYILNDDMTMTLLWRNGEMVE